MLAIYIVVCCAALVLLGTAPLPGVAAGALGGLIAVCALAELVRRFG